MNIFSQVLSWIVNPNDTPNLLYCDLPEDRVPLLPIDSNDDHDRDEVGGVDSSTSVIPSPEGHKLEVSGGSGPTSQ